MLPGIGVFGATPSISILVPILKSCGFNVVALWARTNGDAERFAKDLKIPFYTTKVDEVLLQKDVDLVVVSCPPHLQSPIAEKALGIGKHVLCGVPAGPLQVNSLRMLQAAKYYPRLMSLMIHGLRFLPTMTRMRDLIKSGYIGDVMICEVKVHLRETKREKFDWTCDELMGGGVLNSFGSNIIDLIYFLTSQKAVRVHGMLKTYNKQTEKINGIREITSDDFCTFQMELEDGSCATVTLNSNVPGHFTQEVVLLGKKGKLTAKGADLYGQKQDCHKEELIHFDPINFKQEERHGISEKLRSEIPTPYLKGIIRMIEAVRDGFDKEEERQSFCSDPVVHAASFEESLYIQTVVDAIRSSNKSKEWVKIKIMKEEPDPNPYLSEALRRSTTSLQQV